MATNKQVVNAFMDGMPCVGGNLVSTGEKLWSYQTVIAEWDGNQLILNTTSYSRTTSAKHMSPLKREVSNTAFIKEPILLMGLPFRVSSLKECPKGGQ